MGDKAIDSLKEALKVSPDNVHIRLLLAENLVSQNRLEEAEQEYTTVLDYSPNISAKKGLSKVFYLKENYSPSIVILEEIIEQGEGDLDSYYLYAKALLKENSLSKAIEAYKQALAFDANFYDEELDKHLKVGALEREDDDDVMLDSRFLEKPKAFIQLDFFTIKKQTMVLKNIFFLIITFLSFNSFAQWEQTSLEFTSTGTSYTKFQFAEHSWSGSHAILFNAFKGVSVDGSLMTTGNTKYANDVGSYGGGAGAIVFNGNGGVMHFAVSPGSTGKDTNIDWNGAKMSILRNGNVGIGTTDPDSKLTVAGNIHSREVKVTVDAGADFVFNENYKLTSLAEVEAFINENNHLPEIASEKEMMEKGLELGEMNIKLLQKIEELTLYLIEQNKRIEELESKNKEYKNN